MSAGSNLVAIRTANQAESLMTCRIELCVVEQTSVCIKKLDPNGNQGEYTVQLAMPADFGTETRAKVVQMVVKRIIQLGYHARDIGHETVALIWAE